MKEKITQQVQQRKIKNNTFKGGIIFLTVVSTLPLLFILFYIVRQGIAAINWSFFINLPKPVGESGGGISNAIVGTLMIIGVAAIMAIPFGIFAGIYLSEDKKSKVSYYCRLAVDVLQGIPSIVIGIIIYEWVVLSMHSFSAISGSVALAIMMLPLIVKTTEETLKRIPNHLKEASLSREFPIIKQY